MVIITPETEKAIEWIKENVQTEPWQWLGGGLAIDDRFVMDLIQGMNNDGLTQEDITVMVA